MGLLSKGMPFMPFTVETYLASTVHMSAAETGIYTRIVLALWWAGGMLPDDDVELARRAGVSRTIWKKARATVTKTMTREGGMISESWVQEKLLKASERSRKNKQNSHKRWDKMT